uniref:phenylalanine--tRNA ligase n=2 Tax=Hemiselmis andersenii TaxID=464988 RepID=A0A7S0TVX7_HEMAN
MAEMEGMLLAALKGGDIANSLEWAQSKSVDHNSVIGTLKSLAADEYVVMVAEDHEGWKLTEEGEACADKGSPEAQVFAMVGPDGAAKDDIEKLAGAMAKVGLSQCMQAKWLKVDKAQGGRIFRDKDSVEDVVQGQLQGVRGGHFPPKADLDKLKKRKLVAAANYKTFKVSKGAAFSETRTKACTDITADMMHDGSWKTAKFKPYNFAALGQDQGAGRLHPLLKVRKEFREIFLEMGFEEMPTQRFVETSFWNFDSLFQPQAHPARDMQDTFFIKDPAQTLTIPEDYLVKVKSTHETGDCATGGPQDPAASPVGSFGHRTPWMRAEAEKNLLRTHTTAISAQMLHKLAQEKEFRPAKYFSIDRVFRNETLDATHLAEFHQIEGLVVDKNLTLGDLMGTIQAFFAKLGMHDIRFKPTYNPYTEPSMEIFNYHHGLKKWVEIGNSGMFRPEMLRPMGFADDVSCIAWGLSLERPTMILYGIDNIRDLFGHKVDLHMIKSNPVCRLTVDKN